MPGLQHVLVNTALVNYQLVRRWKTEDSRSAYDSSSSKILARQDVEDSEYVITLRYSGRSLRMPAFSTEQGKTGVGGTVRDNRGVVSNGLMTSLKT
uniref:Uncharacterized protein n=1 Tax=Peronospora matthiolae TaxID=2874970 RepID=A0AAV1V1B5_9STRA